MVHVPGTGDGSSLARIKRAARELFAAQGYERTTVRDIAGLAGLSDAAVLYHYKSKRGILDAILEEPVFPPLAPMPAWDPDAVAIHVTGIFETWLGEHNLFRVMVSRALVADEETIAFNRKIEFAFEEALASALRPWCGAETREVIRVVGLVLCGALLDTLGGSSAPSSEAQLLDRLRRAIRNVLPAMAQPRRARSIPA